jgi:superfamily II DNA or RNA helicase
MRTIVRIKYDNLIARIENPERLSSEITDRLRQELLCEQERFYRRSKYEKVSYLARLKLYDPITGEFPTGLLALVKAILNESGCVVLRKDLRVCPSKRFDLPPLKQELWGYQKSAVDTMLEKTRGVIFVGTGGGKTEIYVEALRRAAVRTLILVYSEEMADQTIARLGALLGLNWDSIGFIGRKGSKSVCNLQDITIGMVQTLALAVPRSTRLRRKKGRAVDGGDRYRRIQQYLESVEMLIVDEGHHGAAEQWYNVSQSCKNAYYRFYLTGTPYREDGYGLLFQASSGRRIVNHPVSELVKGGYLAVPTAHMVGIPARSSEIFREFKDAFEHHVVRHPKLSGIVAQMICQMVRNGRKILVIVRYVEQGERLCKAIEELKCPWSVKHAFIHSAAEDRETLVSRFADQNLTSKNRLNVLIGTAKLVREFLNVPEIDMVISLEGGKSRGTVEQGMGRALRRGTGAVYVDFDVDCGGHPEKPRMLERHSISRLETMQTYVRDSGHVFFWPSSETRDMERLVEKMVLAELSPNHPELSNFRVCN